MFVYKVKKKESETDSLTINKAFFEFQRGLDEEYGKVGGRKILVKG